MLSLLIKRRRFFTALALHFAGEDGGRGRAAGSRGREQESECAVAFGVWTIEPTGGSTARSTPACTLGVQVIKCKQKLLRAYNKHALHLFLWSLIFTILVPVLLMTFFLFFKKNETFQQKKKMHGSLRSEPYRKCSICSVDCRLQSTLRALSFENWLHSLNSTEQHKKTTRQLQHAYKLHIILCLVLCSDLRA